MVRNDWRVPALRTRLCTLRLMKEVRAGTVWLPKSSEVRKFPCPCPPTIAYLKSELVTLIANNIDSVKPNEAAQLSALNTHLRERDADKEFYIDLLGSLTTGNH